MDYAEFQEIVWQKGRELFRPMPWREDTRPYYVLVSELMLQQTQVVRVIPKFEAFIAAFPDEQALAQASLADVLTLWQGLGYNRRAKYLHEAARMLVAEYAGEWPTDTKGLQALPGVGKNTAGALQAYAFNHPSVFIETNVRSVYFYHFFPGVGEVADSVLEAVVRETVSQEHPREWYWALMDYGAWLKQQGLGQNKKSVHYKKQSPLEGSVRQVRGRIIAALAAKGELSEQALQNAIAGDERFLPALNGLLQDGLVTRQNDQLYLTK